MESQLEPTCAWFLKIVKYVPEKNVSFCIGVQTVYSSKTWIARNKTNWRWLSWAYTWSVNDNFNGVRAYFSLTGFGDLWQYALRTNCVHRAFSEATPVDTRWWNPSKAFHKRRRFSYWFLFGGLSSRNRVLLRGDPCWNGLGEIITCSSFHPPSLPFRLPGACLTCFPRSTKFSTSSSTTCNHGSTARWYYRWSLPVHYRLGGSLLCNVQLPLLYLAGTGTTV